jgi:hypothetical protein
LHLISNENKISFGEFLQNLTGIFVPQSISKLLYWRQRGKKAKECLIKEESVLLQVKMA